MTIDPDIKKVSSQFGTDPTLVQSIQNAEGGTRAHLIKAVKCSIKKGWDGLNSQQQYERAIKITCQSINHRQGDYIKRTDPDGFVDYIASYWAPVGASNDPTHLNKNWPKNVKKFWNVVQA